MHRARHSTGVLLLGGSTPVRQQLRNQVKTMEFIAHAGAQLVASQ